MGQTCFACAESVDPGLAVCPHCAEPLDGEGLNPTLARSVGVSVVAVVNIVFGSLGILACVGLLILAISMFGSSGRFSDGIAVAALMLFAICLVIVVPFLPVGIGLLRRRRWARVANLIFCVVWVALSLLVSLAVFNAPGQVTNHLLGACLTVAPLVLFISQGVVLARAGDDFGSPKEPPSSEEFL
jgi:fucose 4-O-acetylase-like acetyltransferase